MWQCEEQSGNKRQLFETAGSDTVTSHKLAFEQGTEVPLGSVLVNTRNLKRQHIASVSVLLAPARYGWTVAQRSLSERGFPAFVERAGGLSHVH
jgi:hypothetical protein